MQRGNRNPLGEVQEREPALQVVPDLLSLFRRQPIPFVGDDDQRPAPFQHQPEQADVLFGHTFPGVEHGDDDMGPLDGLQCLDDTELLDRLADA